VGATVVELQQDYRSMVTAAQTDPPSPTAMPTSRLLPPTPIVTPSPTAYATTATPVEPVVPTPPRPAQPAVAAALDDSSPLTDTLDSHESVSHVALDSSIQLTQTILDMTDLDIMPGQFAQLRMLIEGNDTEGWGRIDRDAWLVRLDDIERAMEAGNTQRAAIWLEEMRQTLLRSANEGMIAPEVAERVVTNIDSIASNNGIVLSSIATPVVDDG
jgi:hypothetical protein